MEIYLYGGCSSCKKADKALSDSGQPYLRRDFFNERFTIIELQTILDRAGVSADEMLSTRSKAYAQRGLAGQSLTDADVLDLMVEEPTLLRRPLILGNGKTLIGYNAAAINELIEKA